MPESVSRRILLRDIAIGALIGTISGLITKSLLHKDPPIPERYKAETTEVETDRRGFFKRIQQSLQKNHHPEDLPKLSVLPEWERTGKDVMIGFSKPQDELENAIPEMNGILKSLPDGTNLHIVAPAENISLLKQKIENAFPNLKIFFYESSFPSSPGCIIYAQDQIFSTGYKDEKGRFVIFTSEMDQATIKADNNCDSCNSCEGARMLGDEKLAEKYPQSFIANKVPFRCEGGDIEITRLPNGKSAVILGIGNISLVAVLTALENNTSFNEIYEQTKEAYKKAFGVDEVIVLGEDIILSKKSAEDIAKFSKLQFYHEDMIVKTAITKESGPIAFMTNPHGIPLQKDEFDYFSSVEKQLKTLGYQLTLLPCGPLAVFNYTNCLMFTPPNGQATVILPQYGFDTDQAAADIYIQKGFKVIKADMEYMKQKEDPSGDGSVHCLVEVLS